MTAYGGFLIAAGLSFLVAFAAASLPYTRYADTVATVGTLAFIAAALFAAVAFGIFVF